MISRLLKILGLFCRISCLLQGSFAIETYNLKAPTHRRHPIGTILIAAEYVYYTYNTESTRFLVLSVLHLVHLAASYLWEFCHLRILQFIGAPVVL